MTLSTLAVVLMGLYLLISLWMTSFIWLLGGAKFKQLWEAFTIGVRWPIYLFGKYG